MIIIRKTNCGLYRIKEKSKRVIGNTATIYNLKKESNYRYIVQAVSEVYHSDNVSREFAIDARAGKIKLTTIIPKVVVNGSNITLGWSAISGVDNYYVYKYYQSTRKLVLSKTLTKNYCHFYNIEKGKTYRYLVSTVKLEMQDNYSGENVISVRVAK